MGHTHGLADTQLLTRTLFWSLIKAMSTLAWCWNVMLVSDIHLEKGTHRCWNE